jgi:hypothetical protein
MTPSDNDERRVHPRRPSELPASLSSDGDRLEGVVENIGEGGVFFATETLEVVLEHGTRVGVAFTCNRNGRSEQIELPGTVLRTERYFDGTKVVRAFAIKFDELFDLTGIALG